MARQQAPDAIVLDLGLPGMDGWTVLDRLKASERTRDIPVHIVSAADDTGIFDRLERSVICASPYPERIWTSCSRARKHLAAGRRAGCW